LLSAACVAFVILAALIIFTTPTALTGEFWVNDGQITVSNPFNFNHDTVLGRIDNLNIHMLRSLINTSNIDTFQEENEHNVIVRDNNSEVNAVHYNHNHNHNDGNDSDDSDYIGEYWGYSGENILISVFDHRTGEVISMDLEKYLVGVVFSEMPASFEPEALKAQAVAARSYTIYKMVNLREEERARHSGAIVCTDFTHCQAYLTFDEAAARYIGDDVNMNISESEREARMESFKYFWHRVEEAVLATAGEIITYNDAPAIAVFHAMSGSMTESADHVWNHAVPYLIAVPTPEADNQDRLRNFQTEARFSFEEFRAVLNDAGIGMDLPRNPRHWIERVSRNPAGRVGYIAIYGEVISGVRLRELFALRSTDFTLELTEDGNFVFTVRGHGHGVGMSQYGANLMAVAGKSYAEILKWYYSGIEIRHADDFLIHRLRY